MCCTVNAKTNNLCRKMVEITISSLNFQWYSGALASPSTEMGKKEKNWSVAQAIKLHSFITLVIRENCFKFAAYERKCENYFFCACTAAGGRTKVKFEHVMHILRKNSISPFLLHRPTLHGKKKHSQKSSSQKSIFCEFKVLTKILPLNEHFILLGNYR